MFPELLFVFLNYKSTKELFDTIAESIARYAKSVAGVPLRRDVHSTDPRRAGMQDRLAALQACAFSLSVSQQDTKEYLNRGTQIILASA